MCPDVADVAVLSGICDAGWTLCMQGDHVRHPPWCGGVGEARAAPAALHSQHLTKFVGLEQCSAAGCEWAACRVCGWSGGFSEGHVCDKLWELAACQRLLSFRCAIICGLVGPRSGKSCISCPAFIQCTFVHYYMWFQPLAWAATILRLPTAHTAMRQVPLFRFGCHGLEMDMGKGSGSSRPKWYCTLCRACSENEMRCILFLSVQLCRC